MALFSNTSDSINGKNVFVGNSFFGNLHFTSRHSSLAAIDKVFEEVLPQLQKERIAQAAFGSHDMQYLDLCGKGTRDKLLARIQQWARDPSPASTIFWLSGKAGTGKSTICRTVAASAPELAASYFFKKNGGDRGKARKLISTLAYQLLVKHRELAPHVQRALVDDPEILEKNFSDQFEKLILVPVKECAATSKVQMLFIVDALNECDKLADIARIVTLFSEARTKSPNMRFLMSSTPEGEMCSIFSKIDFIQGEPRVEIPDEIESFLRMQFQKVREDFQLGDNWPGDDRFERLAALTDGRFVSASTLCLFLKESGQGGPDETLSRLFEAHSGRATLDETYRTILDHQRCRFEGSGDVWGRIHAERQEIIQSIVVLFQPLPIKPLGILLGKSPIRISNRLDSLHSLICVPKWTQGQSPIQIRHDSFRDYLLEGQCTDSPYWIDKAQAHQHIANRCLEVMEKLLRQDLANLKWPGVKRASLEEMAEAAEKAGEESPVRKAVPLELEYACQYWASHVKQAKRALRDGEKPHAFLESHLLHWVEALSLLGRLPEAVDAIRVLQSSLQPESSTALESLLDDSMRFVLLFAPAINEAPLQIYSSALCFCPMKVRDRFQSSLPKWLSLLPEAECDWSPCFQTLESHADDTVHDAKFSPDGAFVTAASRAGTVQAWSTSTGLCEHIFQGHDGPISSITVSEDSRMVASGSHDGHVRIWSLTSGLCEKVLQGLGSPIVSVTFSADDTELTAVSRNRRIQVWEVPTGSCKKTTESEGSPAEAVSFCAGGREVAMSSLDGIDLYSTESGHIRKFQKGHDDRVTFMVHSPDGTQVASASHDKAVRIWSASGGSCRHTLRGHGDSVLAVAFSPGGETLASASRDQTVRLWDTSTGGVQHVLQGHDNQVLAVSFSSDGKMVASSSDDGTARLWSVLTGGCEKVLRGHNGSVGSISFSRDCQRVVSASQDSTVRLWDTLSRPPPTPEAHANQDSKWL